jgi:uncharacterized damage-inducible protein DinB
VPLQDEPVTFIVSTPEPVDGPLTGADRPMLTAYLGWQRMTLLNICAGLDGEQLAARPIASSNLSLLGLIRHLAKVERTWLRQRAVGADVGAMYDPALGRDADFDDLDPAEAEAAVARLRAEWVAADAAVASMAFDDEVDVHGDAFSLRMIYVHLIGEYARHNGHADLLRESLDGVTGR